MAVYTHLSRESIEAMISVFPEVCVRDDAHAGVVDVEPVPQGSINSTWRVTMKTGAVWFLRVNEGKPEAALAHERDVLAALADADLGVVTPRMARSVAGGCFYAVTGDDGARRWASLFPALPGRDLGVFEVTPAHARQVGTFLARAHCALRTFRRRRRNPYGAPVVWAWLQALLRLQQTGAIAERLRASLRDVERRRRPLPAGLVHGDLFIDNTKWQSGVGGDAARLVAVFDWEMAGRDHLALDLAITLCAWAFRRHGADVLLIDDVAAALVDAYQRVRPLRPSERRGFFNELRLAALRFTASRVRDFEVPRGDVVGERRYLDYRDFLARLDLFEGCGERAVRARIGLLR